MKAQLFYRNHFEKTNLPFRKDKNKRASLESTPSSVAKPSLDRHKHQIRNSNDSQQNSVKENKCKDKSKIPTSATTKHSLNATKHNSPFKSSLTNSQLQIYTPNSPKNYKFYYQIGFGAFGRVWKVSDKTQGSQYALKEISKIKVIQKCNINSVLNQRVVLSHLNHPFLINMHRAFQDGQNLYLLMDYLRGADLRYHICYKQHFRQEEIRFIVACLIIGLEYVHEQNIIHKDIKPENIVFQENGYVRLTDFGIAKFQSNQNQVCKSQSSGTPVYMAPEILFKRNYSFESDFYSLGIVIFELAMGRRPYQGKSRSQIRDQLMNKQICLGEFQLPDQCSPELANLINRLLKKNPSERLGRGGIKQIKEHIFFKKVKWNKLQRKEIKPPYIPNVICETQGYLNEISLFNQMNQQHKQNQGILSRQINNQFIQYDFQRKEKVGARKKVTQLRKMRRGSQGKTNL